MALATTETPAGPVAIAVVCDGVSSSPNPEDASLTGAQAAVRMLLSSIRRGDDPDEASTAAVRQAHATAVGYLESNAHRTDYPRYRANGWEIGSGPVESGCKTVVGQRLKLAGMRWREPGTDTVCHLRALFKSERGQWDEPFSGRAKIATTGQPSTAECGGGGGYRQRSAGELSDWE